MKHPNYKAENEKDPELEDIDPTVIERARRWEAGEIPDWCKEETEPIPVPTIPGEVKG